MNPALTQLHPYPFEQLRLLKAGITPSELPHINPSIGAPQHRPPTLVLEALSAALDGLGKYPLTRGSDTLRQTIAQWLNRRFSLTQGIDSESQVIPVSGTREALFAFAQAIINRDTAKPPYVMMPNPFYQIYEGAALLAGAEPYYLNTTAANGYLPDLDSISNDAWQRCQLFYFCSPANPTGTIAPFAWQKRLLELAAEHQFIVAADECYSEIYMDEANPPMGILTVAEAMGNTDYQRIVTFHSLSKRSSLPGLRSGFVAGDAAILKHFLLYRTYHGAALPPHTQAASTVAWQDEAHVIANRSAYREKFAIVNAILAPFLNFDLPAAGFYLWPETDGDATQFTRQLYAEKNVTLLPGSYLSRPANGSNPGDRRVRLALVANIGECREAAERIAHFIQHY
ncbi:MAG: succinyldiaminopimelate transaminase [Gammaproteobacteria bacterium]|nr:succinyldiaminopimelate transaminase [Gammaproteobacteria bacterium]